jgi:hypothetical protein
VLQSVGGVWQVIGFDGYDPELVRPACASDGCQEMQRALVERCAGSEAHYYEVLCASLSEQFARCAVDFRDAVELGGEWGPGLTAMTPLPNTTWGAAVFQRVFGRWVVVDFRVGVVR